MSTAYLFDIHAVPDLDEFTLAYIEAALWSTNDESTPDGGEPLDANYSIDDFAPQTLDRIVADCERFQAANAADLAAREPMAGGHDFWLTRQGHGAGFWDGDWQEDAGERLTTASENFGECYLYVGDDGRLYIGGAE